MLPGFATYCHLIADLPRQFPSIQTSTLTVYTIGPFVAEIEGQLCFEEGYVLDVWELIDFSTSLIRSYSYAVDCFGERMWWYDSQSHPDDPTLAATHPHHKHIHPTSTLVL